MVGYGTLLAQVASHKLNFDYLSYDEILALFSSLYIPVVWLYLCEHGECLAVTLEYRHRSNAVMSRKSQWNPYY